MKWIPRDIVGAKLASGLGIGVLALSLSGLALAQGAPAGHGAAKSKPAQAHGASVKAKAHHAPPKKAAPKADKSGGKKDPHSSLTKGDEKEKKEAKKGPKKPSRKTRESMAAAKVQRKMALARYHTAKKALEEAEGTLGEGSEVDRGEAKAARKAAQDEIKRARKDIFNSHKHEASRFRSLKKDELKAIRAKFKAHHTELRKDRKERRAASEEKLKKKYGAKLQLKTVRHELGKHAWRVARLERLIEIAEVTERPEALAKAQDLLKKQNSAHTKRLRKLSLAPLPKPKEVKKVDAKKDSSAKKPPTAPAKKAKTLTPKGASK